MPVGEEKPSSPTGSFCPDSQVANGIRLPSNRGLKINLETLSHFSDPKNTPSKTPRLPRIPPQLHHQNTTSLTRFSPKPLSNSEFFPHQHFFPNFVHKTIRPEIT
jgi:hypothetical protein